VPLDSRLNALKYYLLQHEQNKTEARANMTSAKFSHAIDFWKVRENGNGGMEVYGDVTPTSRPGKIKSSAKDAPANDYNNGERITLAWLSVCPDRKRVCHSVAEERAEMTESTS